MTNSGETAGEQEQWQKQELDRPDGVSRLVVKRGGGDGAEVTLPTWIVDVIIAEHNDRLASRAALEDLFRFGGIGVDAQGTIFIRDEQALVDQLVKTAEALAALTRQPATGGA